MGYLKRSDQSYYSNVKVIGRDFRFSPIGNHHHPNIQRAADKGEKFAKEYVKHFSAIKAAEAAGLCVGETSAARKGKVSKANKMIKSNPLLKYKTQIDEEIRRMGEVVQSRGVTPELIVDELMQIAFNSDGEFCGNDKLKVTTDHKLKALDMLAKYVGLYEKDNKQKTADTQVLQIAFVGADYAEQKRMEAEEIREVKNVSVDDNPELVKRTNEIVSIVGKKSLDLQKLKGVNQDG